MPAHLPAVLLMGSAILFLPSVSPQVFHRSATRDKTKASKCGAQGCCVRAEREAGTYGDTRPESTLWCQGRLQADALRPCASEFLQWNPAIFVHGHMVRRHLGRLFVTGLIIFVEVVPPHGIFVQRFGKTVPRLGRVDGCWPSSLTRQRLRVAVGTVSVLLLMVMM